MDNVSVVENTVSAVELLANPGFEDSNTSIPGWQQWCTSYCHWGTSGKVTSGNGCYLDDGNCFSDSCLGPDADFLGQSFPATPGLNYTISFALALTGTGGDYHTMFYVDIF
jgi:hypothetical protein